jgi:Tol biopolymer transport system component
MTPPDVDDDDLASVLAACDEALASGDLSTAHDSLAPAGKDRLLKDLECVRLMRQVWPRNGATPSDAAPADVLSPMPERIGRFRIDRELGRGGFGVVYLAFDPQLARPIALKVPRPDVLSTPQLRERFRLEGRAAAGLDHPNIVAVHEAGEVDSTAYIAAAFCHGVTLAAWLDEQTDGVPFKWAASLVAQLADGLEHAHGRGVLHRDLKPANVMLEFPDAERRGEPAPKIADFGLARTVGEVDAALTATGAILGTPNYLAPEQTDAKNRSIGPAVDVYGLGAILYELLTRRPPFQSDDALETLRQVRWDDPVAPRRLRAQVPRDLEVICLKALEKNPAHRYQSAAELAADLRRFIAGEPIRARPVGWAALGWKWARRRPAVAGLLAALVALIAVGVPALVVLWRHAVAAGDAARAHSAARSIALARTAWMTDDSELARTALSECPPALRDAEWAFLNRACHAGRFVLSGHTFTVNGVAFSPDGHSIASVSPVGEVFLWDVQTGQLLRRMPNHVRSPNAVSFKPDGTRLLLASVDGPDNKDYPNRVAAIDVATGEQRAGWVPSTKAYAITVGPDGRTVVYSERGNNALWRVDVETGRSQVVVPPRDREAAVRHAFSPDGRRVATSRNVGRDVSVTVWDAVSGEEIRCIRQASAIAYSACRVSPDGRHLALTHNYPDRPAEVIVCDLSNGRELLRARAQTEIMHHLVYSPGGGRLAVGSFNERVVTVLDAATGTESVVLRGHTRGITCVAFSPDGRHIATGSQDKTVRIWDVGPDS